MRCPYTGLTSQLHCCSALSQWLGTAPVALCIDSLEADPHHARCKRLPRRKHHSASNCFDLKTCSGFANAVARTAPTAQQHSSNALRKGYCLKHAQNCWIYGLLHKKTALKVCMLQRDFKHKQFFLIVHPLHTHPQAHLWLSKAPTS